MEEKVLIGEESKRVEKAARSAVFWEGLNKLFSYVPENTSAYEWLKSMIVNQCEQIENGEVGVGKFAFWKCVKYILDFNMSYTYLDDEPFIGMDGVEWKEEDAPWYVSDEIPEFRLKGEVRKLILRYLTSCAKLARSVSSDTYGFWRELIIQVKFERTLGDGEAVATEVERNLRLLWVDQSVLPKP